MTTTQTTDAKVYPGLLCNSLEFFVHNDQVKAFTGGQTFNFANLPYTFIQIVKDAIKKEPEVDKALKEWHPNNEIKQAEQFAKCRFGGLDFNPDIKNLQLQQGEYWECPFRGQCKNEGVICKQLTYNGHVLNATHIKLIKLLKTSMKNEVLAEELSLPFGSFHKLKKELYQILNVQTKPEAVMVGVKLNLF